MSLAATEANAFLKGIENHARAGNFDQASLQTTILLERMEAAIGAASEAGFEYRKAISFIRELIADCARSDSRSVIEHVHQAQLALGFAPE